MSRARSPRMRSAHRARSAASTSLGLLQVRLRRSCGPRRGSEKGAVSGLRAQRVARCAASFSPSGASGLNPRASREGTPPTAPSAAAEARQARVITRCSAWGVAPRAGGGASSTRSRAATAGRPYAGTRCAARACAARAAAVCTGARSASSVSSRFSACTCNWRTRSRVSPRSRPTVSSDCGSP
jgi:hypothetical protein